MLATDSVAELLAANSLFQTNLAASLLGAIQRGELPTDARHAAIRALAELESASRQCLLASQLLQTLGAADERDAIEHPDQGHDAPPVTDHQGVCPAVPAIP